MKYFSATILLVFASCNKGKTETPQIGQQQELHTKTEQDNGHEAILIGDYLRIKIPNDLPNPGKGVQFLEYSQSINDTIAIGSLADAHSYEVALLGKLKLGQKWLCIMFPSDALGTELEIDTMTTTGYLTNTDPKDYIVTTLSDRHNARNSRVLEYGKPNDGESRVDYNIAFRGHYLPVDVTHYGQKNVSTAESILVTESVQKALAAKKINNHPYLVPGTYLIPLYMIRLMNGWYVALYTAEQEVATNKYAYNSSMFLIAGDAIFCWHAQEAFLGLEAFNLKGQDYIYVTDFGKTQHLTDLYKLVNNKLESAHHAIFVGGEDVENDC